MYTIYDYHFWLAFLTFFIAVFVSYYLPGFLVMNLIDKKINVRNITLSYCIGFVLWTFQGYFLGFLNLRWLTYFYLFAISILSFRNIELIKKIHLYALERIKNNKLITSIILGGMVTQSLLMFGSGFLTSEGVRFLGSNNVDGIMHLGYIQSMVTKFPPVEPGAYQHALRNYHYWIDLNIAELARIWMLPAIHIFFQFLPLYISVVTGISTYILTLVWTGSKKAGLWSLFFLYLGSDAAYLFMLYYQRKFGFYTPAIDNGVTQFLNMPHAAAKMIFTVSLIPFFYWTKTKQKRWVLLAVGLFISLVGYKIYFGIFAGLGLGFIILGRLIKALLRDKQMSIYEKFKKEYFSFVLFLIFIIFSLVIYLPSNSASGGLQYYPLEWPKLFLGQGNLNIREWWLRMQVYVAAGNTRNIIIYDAFAIVVTLICIHGTRILGIIPSKKLYKLLGFEHMLFFIPGIVIFHILGLFTLQKAGSFNVFNFFVVSTVVMSFFSAFLLYELTLKNKIWAKFLIFLIVLLTLPRPVYEIYSAVNSIHKNNGAIITSQELIAMKYIRHNTPPDSIVQSHPKNYLDSRTPYVAYFTNRQTYLTGITMIESHGQQIASLENELNYLFTLRDSGAFAKRAKKDNISYIYLQKNPEQKLSFSYNTPLFSKVFENDAVIVLKLNR